MNSEHALSITQAGYSLVDLANLTVALAIIAAGALSVFYIFVGGISFILSGGSEEKIKKAVHTIRYAIIGLLVTIFSVTMIAVLGAIFSFDLISYISWERILELMQGIIERLTETSAGGGQVV